MKGVSINKMKKYLLMIMAITAAMALTITACTPACPEIGGKAPDFTLETVDGENLSLSDFRGKAIIINFWSTRCGPCVIEMPHIQTVYDRWSDQGLVVLAINISDSAADAKDFIASRGLSFPVLLDPQMEVFQQYCLPQAIPITLFINADGTIKASKVGAFQNPDEIESMLESL